MSTQSRTFSFLNMGSCCVRGGGSSPEGVSSGSERRLLRGRPRSRPVRRHRGGEFVGNAERAVFRVSCFVKSIKAVIRVSCLVIRENPLVVGLEVALLEAAGGTGDNHVARPVAGENPTGRVAAAWDGGRPRRVTTRRKAATGRLFRPHPTWPQRARMGFSFSTTASSLST